MKIRFLTALALLAVLLVMSACSKTIQTDAPVKSFAFSHSGMHTGLIYTLTAEKDGNGWKAGCSLSAGEREYSLDMTDEEAEALASLVRTHQLNRWNGFDRVNRHALDGTGFDLRIGYEDGQAVCASGSNAFPKDYKAAHEAILDFFGKLMERNGIENPF